MKRDTRITIEVGVLLIGAIIAGTALILLFDRIIRSIFA